MAKSQTDLFNRALTKVGAVGSGQSAAAEDVAQARAALTPLLAELDVLEVASIVITGDETAEEIPDEYFWALSTLLAADISPDFGGTAPTDAQRQELMKPLRRVSATKPTYETLQADYF